MTFPLKDDVTWSAGFDQLRPLSKPVAERDHPHGAQDFACPTGTGIYAPEDGKAWYHLIYGDGTQNVYWPAGGWYAFSNYRFNTWGGLVCLEGMSGMTHVFTHLEPRAVHQFCNMPPPMRQGGLVSYISFKHLDCVREGELLAHSGNAGFSMGPHVHYEIHHGRAYTKHADRPRPDELYKAGS